MSGLINPTVGNPQQDMQNEEFDRRLRALSARIDALSGQTATAPVSASAVASSGGITVQDAGGTVSANVLGIKFDETDGFGVSVDNNLARIDRIAATTAPPTGTGVAAAGTSTEAANSDHTHDLVTALNALHGAVTIAANGGCTVTVVGNTIKISVP